MLGAGAGILFAGGAYHPLFRLACGIWGMKSGYNEYRKHSNESVAKKLSLFGGIGSFFLTIHTAYNL